MVDRAAQGCLVWSVIDGRYVGSSAEEQMPFVPHMEGFTAVCLRIFYCLYESTSAMFNRE